ncbi:MAG TPA: glycoside-pentoside-hexuronide (GPH):cation symporter [Candidatus Acidoferrum sp.]|nr:glycoside-pentoside-hexuronide (GPH):cation symporter [Candidatus Acidoferrum sp.]
MAEFHQQLSFREKAGYAVGDIATNFFFQSMILYQNRFYTDTVGLSPAIVGWIFLLARWGDAVIDPAIGALADRTNTRWGKFRPWILATAIPFGLIFWLVYVTPNWGPSGKLIYAIVTYVLVMIAYSANNTPYSALMGVMTADVNERTNIARFRFVAALFGQFIIQALALPLVDKFGMGNSAKGWAITMAIFGSIMIVCNFIVFFNTKERVMPSPEQKPSLKADIRNVFTCGPWLALFIMTLLIFTTLVLRGSSLNYLFNYYMDPAAVAAFLDKVGLGPAGNGQATGGKAVLDAFGLLVKPDYSNAASVGLSFFFVLGSVIQILGILVSKPLADRFGKKAVFITGLAVTTLATAAVFLVGPKDMNQMFFWSVVWPIGWGPTVPLLWVMIADVADYSEWKTSRRATGFMFAGILFALKAGLGLGGALASWIIGAYGYVANAVQTPQALLGIRLSATIYSAIPFGLCLICLALYPITKALNLQIQNELLERRKHFTKT